MALTLEDVVAGVRSSRTFFLKHLRGIREDQWDWKLYPECKSIRETVAHLVVDDKAALYSLQTGEEPDYEKLQEQESVQASEQLLATLTESFEALLTYIQTNYAETPLETEVCAYGTPMKLGRAVAYFSAEDYYHAGQVAYIRMATDPEWDYYTNIYGSE